MEEWYKEMWGSYRVLTSLPLYMVNQNLVERIVINLQIHQTDLRISWKLDNNNSMQKIHQHAIIRTTPKNLLKNQV